MEIPKSESNDNLDIKVMEEIRIAPNGECDWYQYYSVKSEQGTELCIPKKELLGKNANNYKSNYKNFISVMSDIMVRNAKKFQKNKK